MTSYPHDSAAAHGIAVCQICGTLAAVVTSQQRCDLCRASIHLRKPYSIQRCLAFLATAWILYVPANLLPIMETEQLGRVHANTIAGGVVMLWHHGSYPIASVIFVASVLVPVAKMFAIGWLCFAVTRTSPLSHRQLALVYKTTELVGKWSMVDVFVVALLVALIQVGSVLNIQPGPAALAFAGVVTFTMLSARSFDARLIWDRESSHE